MWGVICLICFGLAPCLSGKPVEAAVSPEVAAVSSAVVAKSPSPPSAPTSPPFDVVVTPPPKIPVVPVLSPSPVTCKVSWLLLANGLLSN